MIYYPNNPKKSLRLIFDKKDPNEYLPHENEYNNNFKKYFQENRYKMILFILKFVSGYEADRSYNRDIVIAENINQQVIFDENFKKDRFLFLHVDANKEVDIHFNVIDKAFYKIAILINQKDEEDKMYHQIFLQKNLKN